MKKIFLAITALMMGCPAFAATATSSIPMGVDVPKSCSFFDVSTGIIVPEDGSEAIGNFKMSCNTGYNVAFTSNSSGLYVKNAQGIQIPTTTSVTLWGVQVVIGGGAIYSDSLPLYIGPQSGNFKVKLNSPTTATTPAGIYTDTLNMTVTY